MNDSKMVFTTETGAEPRGGPSLTSEATTPLPPPVKRIAKKTVKKHKPRTRAKATPLHTEVKVDQRVWRKAKSILAEGRYQRIDIIDHETVIVR